MRALQIGPSAPLLQGAPGVTNPFGEEGAAGLSPLQRDPWRARDAAAAVAEARDQVGTPLRDSAWSGRPLDLMFRMTPSLGEGPLPTYPALSTSALPLTSFPSFPKPHLPGPLQPSGPTSSSVLFLILQLWHPLNLQTPRTTHPFGRHPRSTPTVSSNCPFGGTLSAGLRPVVMAVPPSVMALGEREGPTSNPVTAAGTSL